VVDARLLAAFDRIGGHRPEGSTDTSSWLAAATKLSGRDAKRALRRAKVLEALPALGDKLAAGEVSAAHVDALAAVLPAELVPKAGALVAEAGSLTPEELAHKVQQLVASSDGDGGAARNERLRAQQSVTFFDDASGMRAVLGKFDPTTEAGIESAIDYLTDELWRREHPDRSPNLGDRKALAYRRADALAEMCRRSIAGTLATNADDANAERGGDSPSDTRSAADAPSDSRSAADASPAADAPPASTRSRQGKAGRVTAPKRAPAPWAKPLLFAMIDYRILRGDLAVNGICELFNGTPISPDTARRLACDAGIIPMVMGSRGEVLDQGRRTYEPTVAQRQAVWVRDRHCAFPGCRRPAKWTQVHHIVAFIPNGLTNMDNLLLLCDRHHHLVHEGGWRLAGTALDFNVHRPDGTLFEHITRGPP
jgi:Domain of unknown function (DUF222)